VRTSFLAFSIIRAAVAAPCASITDGWMITLDAVVPTELFETNPPWWQVIAWKVSSMFTSRGTFATAKHSVKGMAYMAVYDPDGCRMGIEKNPWDG